MRVLGHPRNLALAVGLALACGWGCTSHVAITRFGTTSGNGATTGGASSAASSSSTGTSGSGSGTSTGTGGQPSCTVPHFVTADLELTTACNPWVIAEGGTDVEGSAAPVLTIDPGVTISVALGASLLAGINSAGQLQINGTAAAPVTFTSSVQTPGSWVGILLGGQSGGSAISWATVAYAGKQTPVFTLTYPGAIVVDDESGPVAVTLSNVTVASSGASAFVFAGPGAGLAPGSGNLYAAAWAPGSYPFVIDANQAGTLPATLSVSMATSTTMVALACQGAQDCVNPMTVNHSQTWPAIPMPYAILSAAGVNVDGALDSATLTIAAPNTLQFAANSALQVDSLETGLGQLVAIGTPTAPIVFEAIDPLRPFNGWQGVQLVAATFGALQGTSMAYCQIADATGFSVTVAGSVYAGEITVNGSDPTNAEGPSITNCTFTNYGGCGIFTEGITNIDIYEGPSTGNAFVPATNAPGGINLSENVCSLQGPVIGTACRLPSFVNDSRELTTDCDPWYIPGGTAVAGAAVLTVDPGVTIAFGNGGSLAIDSPGGLQVNGTAAQQVTFTSWVSEAPRSWVGLSFDAPGSAMTWATVRYAGASVYSDPGPQGGQYGQPHGYYYFPGAIAVEGNSQVSLNHVAVLDPYSSAFVFTGPGAGLAAGSGDLTAINWGTEGFYPFVIDANQVGTLPSSLDVEAGVGTTAAAAVAVTCNGTQACDELMTVDHSQTWPALPLPYAILSAGGINVDGVDGGATLTIAAPNTLAFADQSALQVDALATGQGQLIAVGDAFNPIAFVGSNPDGGANWQGIVLTYPDNNGDPYTGTQLAYCEIENAGLGSASAMQTGELTLQAASFNQSTSDLAVGPSITNCQFSTYKGCGILAQYISNVASYGTPTAGAGGNSFEGGSFDVCDQ